MIWVRHYLKNKPVGSAVRTYSLVPTRRVGTWKLRAAECLGDAMGRSRYRLVEPQVIGWLVPTLQRLPVRLCTQTGGNAVVAAPAAEIPRSARDKAS